MRLLWAPALILQPTTPAVFSPLWTKPARFKGAWGGRGSAKSWDRAQAVVLAMIARPGVRAACVREVQKSIKDSVYQLISDTIQRLGVGHMFDTVENEVRGPNGSLCIFRGMNDQNAESVKSMEGIDIVWWEEAQTASQRSLDLLRPTIRKAGSELWFTWNPRFMDDPVDVLLRQTDLGDSAIVVEAQYHHNPWFPEELEQERLLDKKGDPGRYAHIWEGAYEEVGDQQFIGGALVREARERDPVVMASDPIIVGVDVARFGDDASVIWTRHGMDARSIPPVVLKRWDTMQVAGRVAEHLADFNADACFVDVGGLGAGVADRLRQLKHNVIDVNFGWRSDRLIQGHPSCKNKRAEMWSTMREAMKTSLSIPTDDALAIDLMGPKYGYDLENRIELEKKEDMKKRGKTSPDLADALALTFAYPVEPRDAGDVAADREVEEYSTFGDGWGR